MEKYKGVDDALVAGVELESISGLEIDKLMSDLKEGFEIMNDDDNKQSYFELANQFLRDEQLTLRHYQDDFYIYDDGRYLKIADSDIKAKIMKWVHSHREHWSKAKKNFQTEIFVQIQAICYLDGSYTIPCWITNPRPVGNILVLKNGMIDLDQFINGDEVTLIAHSKDFFCLSRLPFDFEPTARKPSIFLDYLSRVQPDNHVQNLLQEWLGYNLVFDTTLERFMFFIGEGANGKSVFLLLMRLILGKENISSVDLEGFKPTSRFALANTCGKLANIVGDLNEIDKVAEGVLKQYVSGEDMQVERKYKQPFTMKPTARLSYSMNTLPRFCDRSEGVWRRLLLVPWNTTIPEAERNRDFLKELYWIDSGELTGILNWALQGLMRLRVMGDFTKADIVSESVEEFKMESNPTKSFLIENLEERNGLVLSTTTLYYAYQNGMKSGGHYPLSAAQFTREVKRTFKTAQVTPNAVSQGGGIRARNWLNLRLIK